MCGINGFNWQDKDRIDSMNKKIRYRGPDWLGSETLEVCSLGMARLAIIDLSEAGRQPMFSHDKNLAIVFNGEIYNYDELKQQHCKDYPFVSSSDTEMILAMYEKFGPECVKYFNGMWAFCIYDVKTRTLFCSRDRLGIKPFYYYHENGKFIFSSELKAILSHEDIPFTFDPSAICSYLRYRYVIEDGSFFKEIKKLKPGHNLVFQLDEKTIKIKQYWDVLQQEVVDSYNNQKELVEKEFLRSVRYRMIADVEVGSILSGGLDSSFITAAMAKERSDPINTYTVKFNEDGFDETQYAQLVSKMHGTKHHEITITSDEYIKHMQEYLAFKDEPIGVPNEVALFLLFREIRKTATVVLAGEGADETFAGYGRIFRSPFDFLKLTIDNNEVSFVDFFLERYGYFTDDDLTVIKEEFREEFRETFLSYMDACPRDYYGKISYIFLKLHLPGLLARTDQSSMANSVECRVPFLDHNLVQKAFSLPIEMKNHFRSVSDLKKAVDLSSSEGSELVDNPKRMLKEIAGPYLPKEIIQRKKQGFPLPLKQWFGNEYINDMRSLLLKENSISAFLDSDALKQWLDSKDDPMFGQRVWMLYSLETWLSYIKKHYRNVT